MKSCGSLQDTTNSNKLNEIFKIFIHLFQYSTYMNSVMTQEKDKNEKNSITQGQIKSQVLSKLRFIKNRLFMRAKITNGD